MDASSGDIPDLVTRAGAGDRNAFDRLAHRYRPRLESLVALRLGRALHRRLDVEDVVQESLLRAFRAIGSFEARDETSFFRWLGTIAENVVIECKRHHLGSQKASVTREVPLARRFSAHGMNSGELGAILAGHDTNPSRHARRDERFERLEHALESLAPHYREVILLATVQGVPIRDIAARMGKSPNAVSMQLMRALRELRTVFGDTASFRLPPRRLRVDTSAAASEPESESQGESQAESEPPSDSAARAPGEPDSHG